MAPRLRGPQAGHVRIDDAERPVHTAR
jgi:hypothetical protein